ncbi:hypothetical protein PABG_02036 [Paracoccidioides brasiliensis Pb03]|nr:hypothetical protein PABG_02036 [Paracoccidioides brasiliensis Pb03]
MQFHEFLHVIGPEVDDAEEEAFSLFSQQLPSHTLGFVDSRASTLDLTIHGRDFVIRQSPTILSSTRSGGTTGAVVWKITPLIAEWLSSKQNIFWTSSVLNPDSTIVELGCGISGLIAMTLAPSVSHYIVTDQEYVHRLLKENLESNSRATGTGTGKTSTTTSRHHNHHNGRRSRKQTHFSSGCQPDDPMANIIFTTLDWELDSPSTLKQVLDIRVQGAESHPSSGSQHNATSGKKGEEPREMEGAAKGDPGFDLLLACDCIYNDALIEPFVQTCADICRLRPGFIPPCSPSPEGEGEGMGTCVQESSSFAADRRNPTVCVIAQQLRAPDVFESWLQAALEEFWVWRVCDEVAGKELEGGSGYVVHVLVLRG